MIGRYIILYHVHLFTHIHILMISSFYSYIRKIQDTDDWTLMAVLLVGSFTSTFDKTRNMLFFVHQHLWTRLKVEGEWAQCARKQSWKGQSIHTEDVHTFQFTQLSGNPAKWGWCHRPKRKRHYEPENDDINAEWFICTAPEMCLVTH